MGCPTSSPPPSRREEHAPAAAAPTTRISSSQRDDRVSPRSRVSVGRLNGLQASLLFGGVHGLVLAGVLSQRKRNQHANRYLAALLVAISALLLDGVLRAGHTFDAHPHL